MKVAPIGLAASGKTTFIATLLMLIEKDPSRTLNLEYPEDIPKLKYVRDIIKTRISGVAQTPTSQKEIHTLPIVVNHKKKQLFDMILWDYSGSALNRFYEGKHLGLIEDEFKKMLRSAEAFIFMTPSSATEDQIYEYNLIYSHILQQARRNRIAVFLITKWDEQENQLEDQEKITNLRDHYLTTSLLASIERTCKRAIICNCSAAGKTYFEEHVEIVEYLDTSIEPWGVVEPLLWIHNPRWLEDKDRLWQPSEKYRQEIIL
ncbi:MAG: hypothetical protein ACFE7E_05375 [Candidatus Hodarchaeota archaeon]